jgi:hypothetical protein
MQHLVKHKGYYESSQDSGTSRVGLKANLVSCEWDRIPVTLLRFCKFYQEKKRSWVLHDANPIQEVIRHGRERESTNAFLYKAI